MIVELFNGGAAARTFEPVCLHLVFIIVLALSVALLVDGVIVNDGNTRRSDGRTWWIVSDITTLISAGLVVVKWATDAWTIQTGWRCALMLMRNLPLGLKAKDLDHVTSTSVLVLFDWWLPWRGTRPADYQKDRLEKNDKRLLGWLAFTTVVFWLLMPASALAPLLSGAVNWHSTYILVDDGYIAPIYGGPAGLGPTGGPTTWYSYVQALTVPGAIADRRPTVIAAGFASLAWSNIDQPDVGRCRRVMHDDSVPLNSIVENAMIPCIEIHDISYTTNPSQDVIDVIKTAGENVSLIQGQYGPLFIYNAGNAILFDSSRWNESSLITNGEVQLPAPTRFSGVKMLVMLLVRQSPVNCNPMNPSVFGDSTIMRQLQDYAYPWQPFGNDSSAGESENCMLVGTVNFTAGVVKSPKSVYVSNRVVETTTTELPIEPAVFVTDALWMMPDVMPFVSQMNTSEMATWDSIANYTEKLIRYSYMASWDSLNSFYGHQTPDLAVQKAIPMLQASVSKPRVGLWALGHLLVTVTAVMTMIAHHKYHMNLVVDYAAVAMATQVKVETGKQATSDDLRDMKYVKKEYENMKFKVTTDAGLLSEAVDQKNGPDGL